MQGFRRFVSGGLRGLSRVLYKLYEGVIFWRTVEVTLRVCRARGGGSWFSGFCRGSGFRVDDSGFRVKGLSVADRFRQHPETYQD